MTATLWMVRSASQSNLSAMMPVALPLSHSTGCSARARLKLTSSNTQSAKQMGCTRCVLARSRVPCTCPPRIRIRPFTVHRVVSVHSSRSTPARTTGRAPSPCPRRSASTPASAASTSFRSGTVSCIASVTALIRPPPCVTWRATYQPLIPTDWNEQRRKSQSERTDVTRQPSKPQPMQARVMPSPPGRRRRRRRRERFTVRAAAANGSNRIAPRCPRSPSISLLTCVDDLYGPSCH